MTRTKPRKIPRKYNLSVQQYHGIPFRLILYTETHFQKLNAKRFRLGNSSQNFWIPNSCLLPDGTVRTDKNLDWIFYTDDLRRKCRIAGIPHPQDTKR